MTFEEVLRQAMAMLRRQRRVSYRALKRKFDLDDSHLADLTAEIIDVHHVAIDQDGTMLVWTGGSGPRPPPPGRSRRPVPLLWVLSPSSIFGAKSKNRVSEIQRLTTDIEQPLTQRNLINLAHILPKQSKDVDLHLVETFHEVVNLTVYAHPDPMNPFEQLENPA